LTSQNTTLARTIKITDPYDFDAVDGDKNDDDDDDYHDDDDDDDDAD